VSTPDIDHPVTGSDPVTADVRPPYASRASGGSRVAPALFWQQLLASLAQRRVIPVVGPDAVIIDGEYGPRPFVEYVARRLEEMLELGPSPVTENVTLHDVACRFLIERGGQVDELYNYVKLAIADLPVAPPSALRKLARISAFSLYVTTTFDTLLQQAIDVERFHGERRTQVLAYSPEQVQDLPVPMASLSGPLVYHLLGRASPFPDYVVTEEDTLEFVHSLQSENHRPHFLFDELRSNTLLIIGNGYSDWLARFFLRIAKRERLLVARSKTDVVADARARDDASLNQFLRHFNSQTKIFAGGAIEFIDELSARWDAEQATATPERIAPQLSGQSDQSDAVFVSYASEDFTAAQALAEAIRAAGLPIWFDRSGGLQGGDDYESKIRERIEHASFFVPVLSPNVLTSQRRFFRLEWTIAADVAKRASPNLPFLVPVRIGDVPPDASQVPELIRRAHWMDLRRDNMDEVVQRLRTLYREYRLGRPTV
jgi:hypothetical protein